MRFTAITIAALGAGPGAMTQKVFARRVREKAAKRTRMVKGSSALPTEVL